MLKNILNLQGAQKLSSAEQKEINGGITNNCPAGGFKSDINTCLCPQGGVYLTPEQTCSGNPTSSNVYEPATRCCYPNGPGGVS